MVRWPRSAPPTLLLDCGLRPLDEAPLEPGADGRPRGAARMAGAPVGTLAMARPASAAPSLPRSGLFIRGSIYVEDGDVKRQPPPHAHTLVSAPGARGGPLRRPATAPHRRAVAPLPTFQGHKQNPNTVDRVLETALRLARQYGTPEVGAQGWNRCTIPYVCAIRKPQTREGVTVYLACCCC